MYSFFSLVSPTVSEIKSCWFCQTQLYWVSKSKSRSVTFLSPCHPNYTATYLVWCPTWYWWTGFNIDRYLYQVSAGQASIWACIFYRNLQLRFFCLAHVCPIVSRSDNTFYFLLTINAIKRAFKHSTFYILTCNMKIKKAFCPLDFTLPPVVTMCKENQCIKLCRVIICM